MKLSDVIVEAILRVLDDPECTTHQQLTELAKDFERACSRFNQLESAVCAALDVGALSEAARVAKNENLLNEYQTLNFDQLEDWRDACRALDLPVSPPLSSANVARIDEFLETYENHKSLFARRRRFALIGADALSQLKVVRDLQLVFPACPIWDSQIRMLEALNEQEFQAIFQSETHPLRKWKKLDEIWQKLGEELKELGEELAKNPQSPQKEALQNRQKALQERREKFSKKKAELEPEIKEANRRLLKILPELLAPLESPERLEPCSPQFLKVLRDMFLALRKEAAMNELDEAIAEYNNAKTASNAALPEFLDAWVKAYRKCQELGINLAQRYDPQTLAQTELAQKYNDAYNDAVAKIKNFGDLLQNRNATLEAQTDAFEAAKFAVESLNAAVNAAVNTAKEKKLDDVITPEIKNVLKNLGEEYQKYIEEHKEHVAAFELQKRRMRVLCVAAAVLFCSLLSVALFFVARQRYINNEAITVAAALEVQLDSFARQTNYDALADAEKTIEEYYVAKSPITQRSAFIEQAERCKELRAVEEERLARFKADVDALKAIHKTEKARPDLAKRIKDAAFAEQEKKEAQALKKRDDDIVNANNNAYLQRLDSLVDQKNDLVKSQISDLETRLEKIQELQKALQKLDDEFDVSGISPRAKAQSENFASSLADLRAIAELTSELQGAAGDSKKFEEALTRYKNNISKGSYLRTLDALNLVSAFDAWNGFAQTDAKSGAWTQTVENFESRRTSLAPAFNTLSEFLPEINDVRARFQTLSKRRELTQELQRVFKFCKPELYVFADLQNTKYYYLTSLPTIDSPPSSVECCVDVVDGVATTQSFNQDLIKSSAYAYIERAPQYVLYQKIQKLPALPSDDEWFGFVENVVDMLIVEADEQTLDPAVKVVLLKHLSSVLCQDPELEFFEEWRTALADVDLNVNLYQAGTRSLRELRETANDVWPQIKLASAQSALRRARTSAQNRNRDFASLPSCRWVGFVDVAGSTARLASNDNATLEDGTLYVAEFIDGSVKARVFGKVQDGQATVAPRSDFTAQRWNLVFLRPDATNSSSQIPEEIPLPRAAPFAPSSR